jgi:hypothetical protein
VPTDVSGRTLAPRVDLRAFKESHMFPVLDRPPRVPAHLAEIPKDDLVLGVERGKEAVAYPVRALAIHHIVNDEIAGAPVTVAFCQKCYSGVAHRPIVDGQVLTFETGGTYMGAMLMRDRATGTRWSQITGEALIGSLVGHRLDPEPLFMGTLEGWLEAHPDSATPDPSRLRKYDFARLGPDRLSSVSSKNPHWDRRMPGRTLILGIATERASRAYVVNPLRPGPMLHEDELSDVPLVLLGGPGMWPIAFDRRIEGRAISLTSSGGQLLDETGSTFAADGSATGGRWDGRRLVFLPSQLVEWHAWAAYHPDTDIVDLRD